MKKTMIFAALAAMFMFASCQKEEATSGQGSQSDELVFTAAINQSATKTTINTDASSADRGKVSWEVNDEISVSDGANTAVYYIKEASDIATDGSAAFTYKSGTRPSASAASYTASYGNAITTAQTYSATAGKLPMSGVSDSGNKTKLNFTVSCGLLKLNLTALGTESDKTISKVEIIGTPTGGTKTTYTLSCSSEVSISSAADFYIALPAGSYTDMVFYNKGGYVCQKTKSSGMTIVANKIQPVTLSGIAFNLLPGKFSVGASKQVRFTKGNLYWNGSAFKIESSQTDYQTSWDANHVSHLYWTKTAATSYAASYNDGTCATNDKFFADGSDADHMLTVDGQSSLYALTKGEWTYLINSRTSGLYKYGVTVTNGGANYTNCLIIAPDDYSGTALSSITDWSLSNINTLGLVCLPAAGYRNGSDLSSGGSHGYYWTATPSEYSKDDAYYLFFLSSFVYPDSYDSRYYGYSVRLVCSVQ